MKDQVPEFEYQKIAADIHNEDTFEGGVRVVRQYVLRLGPIAVASALARSLESWPESERTRLDTVDHVVAQCGTPQERLSVLQIMRGVQAPCYRGMYYSHCHKHLSAAECRVVFAERGSLLAEVAAAMPKHRRNIVSDPCIPCEGKLRYAQDLVLSDLTSLFVHRSPKLIDVSEWSRDPIGAALLIRVLSLVWFMRYAGSRLCVFDDLEPSFCKKWQGRTLQTLALIDARGDGWKKFGTSLRIRKELERTVRSWRDTKQSPENPY